MTLLRKQNIGHSVFQRLLNHAKNRGEDFNTEEFRQDPQKHPNGRQLFASITTTPPPGHIDPQHLSKELHIPEGAETLPAGRQGR